MKRITIILTSLLLLAFMQSCLVVSIHPIGTAKERMFDPDLLGKWAQGDGIYHFHSLGDSLYYLQVYGPGLSKDNPYDTLHFELGLYEVGEYLFLDYFPYEKDKRDNHMFYENYLPVHTFAKLVKHNAEHIELYSFDNERLQRLFDQNRIRLRYEEVDDVTVLTDGTADIRRFIKKYAGDPEAFEDADVLIKQP